MSSLESDLATQADEAPASPGAPTRTRALVRGESVGRYVVLERLGVGGMGEVFAAYDPELDRKIALKLLLPGRADAGASVGPSRLVREAQAMAKLRHRNVITVHDVGTHEGRVFVAMEFVEGGTLADWMAQGRDGRGTPHPWQEVIARFAEAGRGLAAAHAAGLIHRDFKPANVLVGRDGQVQVADFGLVRRASVDDPSVDEPSVGEPDSPPSRDADVAVDSAATLLADASPPSTGSARSHDSLSQRMTQTGAMLGTPAYMAPEQFQRGNVDARADQFGFCVALWEALYGERPFTGESLHALMFAIDRGSIREPADERGVPAPIRRALVRGLAKHPDRRWPDMDALLVALRFDPARVRRRRIALVGTLALMLALAIAKPLLPEGTPPPPPPPPPCLGAADALGDALSPARRTAIADRFGGFEHAWARDVGDRLFPRLDGWVEDWKRSWTDACEDTHVRGEQSTDLLDRRMLCLDRRRRGFVGLVDALIEADEALAKRADSLFDALGTVASCDDAEALLRITPLPDDPAEADAILRAEEAIAGATGEYLAGRYAEARTLLEQQRTLVERLDHAPLSAAFEQLSGDLAIYLDDRAGGEKALERAFVQALAAGDDRLAVKVGRSLAMALTEQDRSKDALRWLDIASALAERNDDDDLLGALALTRSQALANDGDYPGAEAAALRALELLRAGPESSRVGDAYYMLGTAAYRAGRNDEAIERVEQARAAWATKNGPRHPRAAAALGLLGVAARTQGKYADAQRYFEEALAIKVGSFGPDHVEVTDQMMNLAVAMSDQGKLAEAIVLLRRALAIRRAQPGASASEVGRSLVNLAQMLRQAGRLDEALAAIDEGEPLMREAVGDDHPDIATVLNVRAMIELALARPELADRTSREAVRIAEAKLEPDNPALLELHTTAAEAALALDRPAAALAWLDRGSESGELEPEQRARRQFVRAKVLAELDRLDEALPLARAAKTEFETIGGKALARVVEVDRWLARHPSEGP
ncbi:tetratricopeptide repeat protein [Nannocystaceae bacterium ST9]